MSVDISNESSIEVDTEKIFAVARHALAEMGVNQLAELSVLLVDTEAMTALNERWMDKEGPTDVLAFPMDALAGEVGPHRELPDVPLMLGDIVLCPQVAQQQARAAGHALDDELHLLTVHGVLHLLGYDHADDDTEREMFALQGRLLSAWRKAHGITRPMRIPQTAADLPYVDHAAGQVGRDSDVE